MPIYTCKSTVLFSDYQNMKPIYRALNVKIIQNQYLINNFLLRLTIIDYIHL